MTRRNSPNDTIVIGIVSRISKGFTVTFNREMITATMKAVKKASKPVPASAIPGSKYAATITATDDSNSLVSKLISFRFKPTCVH